VVKLKYLEARVIHQSFIHETNNSRLNSGECSLPPFRSCFIFYISDSCLDSIRNPPTIQYVL